MADSPRRRDDRSRSPPRKAPKGSGGFRWKEKGAPRGDDDGYEDRDRRNRGLERGYRNRSPRRDNRNQDRDREGDRGKERERDGDGDQGWDRDGGGRSKNGDRDRDWDRVRPRRDGGGRDSGRGRDTPSSSYKKDGAGKKEKKPAMVATTGGEEMIIVNVNDRLGTKAQIPCLGSDTIKQLKIMVAMRVGREPHEILLKRQGERPFKDQLTVADYGISNGVQLDLEVDTGD